MNAKELIGKEAIRTAPIMEERTVSNGMIAFGETIKHIPNYHFCETHVLIVNATDNHVVVKVKGLFNKKDYDEIEPRILDCRFCDDNWTDYSQLIHPNKKG
ncbi:hypothetical protein [Anaerovorax sp. IOR16]|uniref:hypothetical protein n=1 Tax=Anaerovorax sp. IOR16 TaxID=2773458 RepID=UPI0019CF57B5|nr:hypothetical protein [Anaerovorax sp. IOR16]